MNTTNYELVAILVTVIIQALYIAFKMGKFEEKLDNLEEKQNKHNNLIERMVMVESSLKAVWHNLDKEDD